MSSAQATRANGATTILKCDRCGALAHWRYQRRDWNPSELCDPCARDKHASDGGEAHSAELGLHHAVRLAELAGLSNGHIHRVVAARLEVSDEPHPDDYIGPDFDCPFEKDPGFTALHQAEDLDAAARTRDALEQIAEILATRVAAEVTDHA